MAKILLGVIAAIACFILVESLDCNQCSVSVFGFCLNSGSVTCSTNTSVCFTSKAEFPSVSSFSGFSSQGCTESADCPNNSTSTNGTLAVLGVSYTVTTQCCSTAKCNPVTISGAPTSKMTLSLALSAAALAAFWGSYM